MDRNNIGSATHNQLMIPCTYHWSLNQLHSVSTSRAAIIIINMPNLPSFDMLFEPQEHSRRRLPPTRQTQN